ncbi:SDR family NAD(P)-dependent oxidoreductase [Herbiconiux sp. CPCC 203407]|uniref:SDR family NAD(P)-dependent oxidoreductase n=1 Tax=Herbiconiux oxytropis TaxID=2970915 RepID=A0AA41XCL2_9MICO|nr:SDR family NAD(P)-dependent oxidoreductase [Herbiconiux oxytropis]MCS5722172.1 SDR family NAD(P)-dependent oxidoreductase [Herbiconiux oxytropis]MCS5725754.1 SDR family NAD(P)-dependent oxidoreductase [Herbiconiux oxytropis]
MRGFEGEVAVVTGGGSGIGRAIAAELVRAGARVAVADIDADAAERAARELGVEAFQVDVSSTSSVQALAAGVRDRLGPAAVLVNNAGVASAAPLERMTDADWDWLLGVNLSGTIHGVTAFLPQLRQTRGRILNTGSMAGLSPDAGMGGYGTTKFAVTAYTEVLAEELAADGIAVTLLAPGPVRTALGSSSRNRPGSAGAGGAVDAGAGGLDGAADRGLVDVDLAAGDGAGLRWITAEEVAAVALDALRDGRRYAITHPDWAHVVHARHCAIEKAFADALAHEQESRSTERETGASVGSDADTDQDQGTTR